MKIDAGNMAALLRQGAANRRQPRPEKDTTASRISHGNASDAASTSRSEPDHESASTQERGPLYHHERDRPNTDERSHLGDSGDARAEVSSTNTPGEGQMPEDAAFERRLKGARAADSQAQEEQAGAYPSELDLAHEREGAYLEGRDVEHDRSSGETLLHAGRLRPSEDRQRADQNEAGRTNQGASGAIEPWQNRFGEGSADIGAPTAILEDNTLAETAGGGEGVLEETRAPAAEFGVLHTDDYGESPAPKSADRLAAPVANVPAEINTIAAATLANRTEGYLEDQFAKARTAGVLEPHTSQPMNPRAASEPHWDNVRSLVKSELLRIGRPTLEAAFPDELSAGDKRVQDIRNRSGNERYGRIVDQIVESVNAELRQNATTTQELDALVAEARGHLAAPADGGEGNAGRKADVGGGKWDVVAVAIEHEIVRIGESSPGGIASPDTVSRVLSEVTERYGNDGDIREVADRVGRLIEDPLGELADVAESVASAQPDWAASAQELQSRAADWLRASGAEQVYPEQYVASNVLPRIYERLPDNDAVRGAIDAAFADVSKEWRALGLTNDTLGVVVARHLDMQKQTARFESALAAAGQAPIMSAGDELNQANQMPAEDKAILVDPPAQRIANAFRRDQNDTEAASAEVDHTVEFVVTPEADKHTAELGAVQDIGDEAHIASAQAGLDRAITALREEIQSQLASAIDGVPPEQREGMRLARLSTYVAAGLAADPVFAEAMQAADKAAFIDPAAQRVADAFGSGGETGAAAALARLDAEVQYLTADSASRVIDAAMPTIRASVDALANTPVQENVYPAQMPGFEANDAPLTHLVNAIEAAGGAQGRNGPAIEAARAVIDAFGEKAPETFYRHTSAVVADDRGTTPAAAMPPESRQLDRSVKAESVASAPVAGLRELTATTERAQIDITPAELAPRGQRKSQLFADMPSPNRNTATGFKLQQKAIGWASPRVNAEESESVATPTAMGARLGEATISALRILFRDDLTKSLTQSQTLPSVLTQYLSGEDYPSAVPGFVTFRFAVDRLKSLMPLPRTRRVSASGKYPQAGERGYPEPAETPSQWLEAYQNRSEDGALQI